MKRSVWVGAQSIKRGVVVVAAGAVLAACDARTPPDGSAPAARPSAAPFYGAAFERRPSTTTLAALGRALFFDPALSASGRMSCASCHDAAHAWGPPNDRAVQLGGADLRTPGVRAVPSLRYQQDTPPFTEHFTDDDDDDGADQGPAGGRDWDGRASSAHEQARTPLISPFEMANADSAAVIARLARSPLAARFRDAFGDHVFAAPTLAWNGLLLALEVFQQNPADFYPYTSRYDAYLRGTATLSAEEQRGLAAFNDPARGNCAECHPSARQRGALPQFTDRGFVALGVPRNGTIPVNKDPGYFDLGLCGPLRTDLTGYHDYCALFKTPTLRNVALRHVFFHNGVLHSLEDVVRFYQQRDVHPNLFYPPAGPSRPDTADKFDDVPLAFRHNISFHAPFDSTAHPRARFSDADAAAIVAFLRTLTDSDMAKHR